jgi:GNAT superfamily N-acetyltransferase
VDQGLLVAVGGLTCDPFAGRLDTGRIRSVYVRPAWRNQGIGRALVTALVEVVSASRAAGAPGYPLPNHALRLCRHCAAHDLKIQLREASFSASGFGTRLR